MHHNTVIDYGTAAIPAAPGFQAGLVDPLTDAAAAIPITAWITADTYVDRGDSRLLVGSKMVAAVAGPDGTAVAAQGLPGFVRLLQPDEQGLPGVEVQRELRRRQREQEYALHDRLTSQGGAA